MSTDRESASSGCSALTLPGSRVVEECPRGAADQTTLERSKTRLWGVYSSGIVKWKSRLERQMGLARWTKALLIDDEVASAKLAVVVGGYLKEAGRQRRHGLPPGGMS